GFLPGVQGVLVLAVVRPRIGCRRGHIHRDVETRRSQRMAEQPRFIGRIVLRHLIAWEAGFTAEFVKNRIVNRVARNRRAALNQKLRKRRLALCRRSIEKLRRAAVFVSLSIPRARLVMLAFLGAKRSAWPHPSASRAPPGSAARACDT